MDRTDVAYLINTTPKYFYLLPLHLTLLQRYAPKMQWPIYLATEAPMHPSILKLQHDFPSLRILPLTEEQEGFLDSRFAACEALPQEIQYVLPMQDDFLLEGRPMEAVISEALQIMDSNWLVDSARLMPCPGPRSQERYDTTEWRILQKEEDDMIFTYQATVWRRRAYTFFMKELCLALNSMHLTKEQKNQMAIRNNIAEIQFGQGLLLKTGAIHLAWPREGSQPNAVYLSPWPYRPTAVVHGTLQVWAEELADREKVLVRELPSLR